MTDPSPRIEPEPWGPGKDAAMHFTITHDRDGYRARLYSGGNLVWWTEGYVKKATAQNAISIAKATNAQTPVYDRT